MPHESSFPPIHATTILAVRDDDAVAIAGDGQVTLGQAPVQHLGRDLVAIVVAPL